ncbi:ImmA/IrrE family metallo-endopeptidase [Mycoplasma sp. P36-A1]|uniref:ImmA/IrrE family metallo-endopeptidase n=1 Tax=Mycoplasma sp. P36-A1 TaxID=3252900 RepID=UPI003C2BD10D
MGLTVIYKEIIDDCSIFDQIFFQVTEVDGKEVKAGTMFVDSRVAEIRNIEALNNTVIHECVHWHKHRLAFELVRLYEPELSNIVATVEEFDGIKSSHLMAIDWMEWHARALAPKILLPNKMFKQHVDFIQREYNLRNNGKQKSYEELIDQLSTSFEVSKLAAKIRLVECGFEQAIVAYNWIDGHYVQAHTWKTETLNPKQTFTTDTLNAALQSVIDPELREKLNSGKYIYIDSHFVLNTPKYVEIEIFGDIVLTEYALRNMHECALVFDVALKNKNIS